MVHPSTSHGAINAAGCKDRDDIDGDINDVNIDDGEDDHGNVDYLMVIMTMMMAMLIMMTITAPVLSQLIEKKERNGHLLR